MAGYFLEIQERNCKKIQGKIASIGLTKWRHGECTIFGHDAQDMMDFIF